MRALEVELNGKRIAVAGSETAVLLSAGISAAVNERGGTLRLTGMKDLGNEVRSHLSWIDMLDLAYADRVTVRFSDVEEATPLLEEARTDTVEYATRQAEYEEQLRTDPPQPRIVDSMQQDVVLKFHWGSDPPVIAVLESGREMIMCQFTWNSFRPDRCRVSLRSVSQEEAYGRTGGREWFSGILNVGEACAIELDV